MAADPLDEYDPTAVIDGRHQSIVIPFDVEDHAVGADKAGIAVMLLHVRGALPMRLQRLTKPCVQRRLERPVVLMAGSVLGELDQRIPEPEQDARWSVLQQEPSGRERGLAFTGSTRPLKVAHQLPPLLVRQARP